MTWICPGVDFEHNSLSGNKEIFFSPLFHVRAGSQEHLLVSSEQTHIQAALVSLMPFNNVSCLEESFSPLILIAINYYHQNSTQSLPKI